MDTQRLVSDLMFAASHAQLPELELSEDALSQLLTYSTSIPTGTTLGKRWKRNPLYRRYSDNALPKHLWVVGEYVPHPDPGLVGICWYRVKVVP